jgi:hypothetical protein
MYAAQKKNSDIMFSSLNEVPYDEHMRQADFYTLVSLLPKEIQCCDGATD